MTQMRIVHIATAADWERAKVTGAYTTSTRGRTLEEEGFLHASREEQVEGVAAAYYADVDEPLVLLTIETGPPAETSSRPAYATAVSRLASTMLCRINTVAFVRARIAPTMQ